MVKYRAHVSPTSCPRLQNIDKFVLFGLRRDKSCLQGFANNKGADQPAHPCSLISAFVIRVLERIIYKHAIGETTTS